MSRTEARCHGELLGALAQAESVAICCHLNPDGDTVGSALALRLGLERLGRRAEVFCCDKVPDSMLFLPGAEKVRRYESLGDGERFDLLLPVDVSDAERMGRAGDASAFQVMRGRCARTAQVDHHGTNPLWCEVNDVDGGAPAAGLLVRELLSGLGLALDRDLAKCLYTAIATDTGNFSHGNTTAECFRVAAELMEAGLPLAEVNRALFLERPMAQQLLTARAMASLRYEAEGRIGVMLLSAADFAAARALPEHADTIVNLALQAEGVRMALLARETGTGIKMSLRALAPDTVDQVARRFGGGGHAQAAGCTLQGALAACAEQVAAAMAETLRR